MHEKEEKMKKSIIVLGALFFLGCNNVLAPSPKPIKHYCKERAQVCPMLYAPVCGYPTYKTYSNGCFACSDKNVSYYIMGKCK